MKLPALWCIATFLCSYSQAAEQPAEIKPGVRIVGTRAASLCQTIKYPSINYTSASLEEVLLKIKQTLQDLETDKPYKIEFALGEDAPKKTWSYVGSEVSLLDLLINISESLKLDVTFTESKLTFAGK